MEVLLLLARWLGRGLSLGQPMAQQLHGGALGLPTGSFAGLVRPAWLPAEGRTAAAAVAILLAPRNC